MLARIQIRRDSKTNWDANNPILHAGEIGYETLTERFKIGDGTSNWSALPYQLGHWDGQTNGDISFGYQLGENNVNIANNLQIDGNLFVKGTTTTVNTKEVTFADRMLTLNWNEDPIKHYDSSLISGLDINIGWPDTAFAPAYSGVDFTSVSSYDSTNNQTVITLNSTLSNWPATYKQNYVIYFSPSEPFGDPDLAFFIKSYDSNTNELTVVGDASAVPNTKDFEIHNVIRQLYWKNDANSADAAWYVDGNKIWHEGNLNIAGYLPLSGGTLTGNLDVAGEINFSGTRGSFVSSLSQPRIYRSGSESGTYPFDDFGHLILQTRTDGVNRDIVFATGTDGANLTVIKSDGKVGIGTSSPQEKLDVLSGNIQLTDNVPSGGNAFAGGLQWYNTNSATYTQNASINCIRGATNFGEGILTFSTSPDDNGVVERMRIDDDGNVGIGTNSPSYTLDVRSDATDAGGKISLSNSDASKFLMLLSGQSGDNPAIFWENNQDLRFSTASNRGGTSWSEKMRIKSDGKVGIGTSSPNQLLTLSSSVGPSTIGMDFETNGVSRGSILYDANAGNMNLTSGYSGYGGKFIFSANGAERMRIDTSGAVLIGNSSNISNSNLLEVKGSQYNYLTNQGITILPADGNSSQQIYTNYSSGGSEQSLALGTFSNRSNQLFLRTNGCVGIGTASPGAILNIGVPSTANIGTLYTSTRDYDDPHNRVDLLFQYKYKADGSYTHGSQISFAKDSTVVDEYGSDIRFLTRQHGYATSEKMRITGDGKVGIGRTNPHDRFEVEVDTDEALRIVNTNGTMRGYFGRKVGGEGHLGIFDASSNERIHLDSTAHSFFTGAGNVGIGTSSPAEKLEVSGAIKLGTTSSTNTGTIRWSGTDFEGYDGSSWNSLTSGGSTSTPSVSTIFFNNETTTSGVPTTDGALFRYDNNFFSTNKDALVIEKTDLNGTTPDGGIAFTNRGSGGTVQTSMVIRGTGLVGIGTTSPQTKLHLNHGETSVNGPQEVLRLQGDWNGATGVDGDGALIRFTNQHNSATNPNTGEYNVAGIAGLDDSSNWGGSLHFQTSPTAGNGGNDLQTRMVVRYDGNVGIGVTNPEALLTLRLDTGIGFLIEDPAAERLHMLTRDGSGHGYYIGYADGETVGYKLNSSGDSYFVGGDVGIGTSSPASELDVDGVIRAGNNTSTGGGTALRVKYQSAGDHTANFGAQYSSGAAMLGYCVESSQSSVDTFVSTADNAAFGRGALVVSHDLDYWSAGGQTTTVGNPVTMYNRFHIDSSGNVGIGESSPSSILHLKESTNGTTAEIILSSNDASVTPEDFIVNRISFHQTDTSGSGTGTTGAIAMKSKQALNSSGFYGNAADMGFYVSGSAAGTASDNASLEAMTIQRGTGNVGIGTTSPTAPLDVDANSDAVNISLRARTGTDYSNILFKNDAGGSDLVGIGAVGDNFRLFTGSDFTNVRLQIDGNGNVGIGDTTPAEKLEVNGAIKLGTTSNTNAGTLRWSGSDFEGYTGSAWESLTAGNGLQEVWHSLGSTNYDSSTSPQYDYKFYRITNDLTYDNNRVYEVIVDADDNSGMVAIYHLYLSSHSQSGNHDRIMMSHVSGRPQMMRVVLDSNEHVWIAGTNKWGVIRIRGMHENESVTSMPFAASQLANISSPQFNETAQFIWNGDNNTMTLIPTVTLNGSLGIGTNDPKLKTQISGGSLFIDGGGYNPDSTPPSGYYTSLSNDTNHSPGIVIGNEWAWDSSYSSSTGGAIWVKGHLHNYNGAGMRLSMNDGSLTYDHTANSWGSAQYDEPDHSASSISVLRAQADTESVFTVNIKRDTSNYAQSGTVFGDLLDVKHSGYTTVKGALNVGETSTNLSGTIRYNSTTDDFEGKTTSSGWVSLTQKRVNFFLDNSIARTVAGNNTTWTWGPTGSGATHIVANFTNFKNSSYASYDRLCFFGGSGYVEVVISDLLAINPTSSARLYIGYDDQEQFDDAQTLWFDGNDLWLQNAISYYGGHSNAIFKYYRIDAVA